MTRADKTLILVTLLIVVSSYYLAWQPTTPGSHVEIYQGNTLYKKHDLTRNAVLEVPGKLGDSVIEIDAGRARFQASPCTGKFCIHSGWMQHTGDIIACLPNGIHLQIHGGQSRFDAIAF